MLNSDLIYYQKGGKIKSLGYTVNSSLLEKGLPVIAQSGGGSMSDLVIPAGLLLLQQTFERGKNIEDMKVEKLEDVKVIDDGIYEKLLQLVSVKKKRRRTRRHSKKRKNKTRKKG